MTDDPRDALARLFDRLAPYLRADADLRAAVAGLGRSLTTLAEAAAPPPPVLEPPAAPEPPAARPPLAVAPAPVVVARPAPAEEHDHEGVRVDPPEVIAARCRIKADAARVAARLAVGDLDVAGEAAALIAKAKGQPNCYLWMLDPPDHPVRPAAWAALAGSFAAAADAADLLTAWLAVPPDDQDRFATEVLYLVAEAQSGLRAATADAGRFGFDTDQLQLFVTVREQTQERSVYVSKYMRRDDPADPAKAADVARRAVELTGRVREAEDHRKARRKGVKNLQYKVGRVLSGVADEWPGVVRLLDELVAGGLPPSNVEVRDVILPVAEARPDDLPLTKNAFLVFRAVDGYLANRPPADDPPADDPPTAEVAEVCRLLTGREVVLIGGHVRPQHERALTDAFGLSGIRWLSTPEHTSFTVFEADIARPEVAVVLLAIRWTSHSYAEVDQYCAAYGKPLVRLPRGYNRNMVAFEILRQAGGRLRGG